MPTSETEAESFLLRERVAVFCTVDPEHHPHAVPVFFTYHHGKVYVHTDRESVKVRNVLTNPNVALVVYRGGYGEEAVVIRGRARIVEDDEFERRTQEHIEKYHLHLDEQGRDSAGVPLFDSAVRCVIEVTVERLIFW